MPKYDTKIINLFTELKKDNILKNIFKSETFPGEPKMHTYTAYLNSSSNFSDGKAWNGNAGGFSFASKELALLKCLCEAAERFSNSIYRKSSFVYSSFQNLSEPALDPTLYKKNSSVKQKIFAWTKGFDVMKGSPCFIPAQLIYFNYQLPQKEPHLSEFISTGAAGGFDHESTLLRGIYEVVERDAFMCMYLTKSSVQKIDVSFLQDKEIQHIAKQAKRYNLELHLFDITHDLTIPTFMSIVLDRTGFGPTLSVGLKCNLSSTAAVIGALEESFHTRPWMKKELIKRKTNQYKLAQKNIHTLLQRGLFWMKPHMLDNLFFLFNQPLKKINLAPFSHTPLEEIEIIKKIFAKKDISLFYADITAENFRKIGYLAYKVVVPQLQPLYLHENHKTINMKRLKTVACHFGKEEFVINTVPHPFL